MSAAISSGVVGSGGSPSTIMPYSTSARIRVPFTNSCLYADFGLGGQVLPLTPRHGRLPILVCAISLASVSHRPAGR